jgi:hypothetical protein
VVEYGHLLDTPHNDTLVRENAHWKFQRRVVMMESPYQDPRDIKGEPPVAPPR